MLPGSGGPTVIFPSFRNRAGYQIKKTFQICVYYFVPDAVCVKAAGEFGEAGRWFGRFADRWMNQNNFRVHIISFPDCRRASSFKKYSFFRCLSIMQCLLMQGDFYGQYSSLTWAGIVGKMDTIFKVN
jgi:hypothetical protein